MSQMRMLGAAGDTTLTWDPEVESEVAEAKSKFDELVHEKGGFGFKTDASGSEQVKEFDPSAEELVVTPQMAGG